MIKKHRDWITKAIVAVMMSGVMTSISSAGKTYSYEISPERRQALVDTATQEMGISDDASLEALFEQVIPILSTKTSMQVDALVASCAAEIDSYCADFDNGFDLVDCMKENRDQAGSVCEQVMATEFGGKPLKEPLVHNGVQLPVGTTFIYDGDPDPKTRQRIGAVIPSGQTATWGDIVLGPGQVRFAEDRVSDITLAHPQRINGILFKDYVYFDWRNSTNPHQLERGVLAESTEINGITCRKGTWVSFQGGQLASGVLDSEHTIQGQQVPAKYMIHFDASGKLESTRDHSYTVDSMEQGTNQ